MVAEMRCVTSIYRLELGSGDYARWYLGSSVVGVPKSYRHKIKGHYLISACGVMVNPTSYKWSYYAKHKDVLT